MRPDGRARRSRPDPRRQPPLPRRGGGRLRRQVGDLVRRDRPPAGARQGHEAARPAARAVRALARDRLRHRLLHAQPDAGRRDRARRRARTSRPGMLRDARGQRGRGSASRSRPRPATPPSSRSRTRASTSCSATRCCTTCPTSSARSPSSPACCAPGGTLFFAGEPSRHGDRIAAVPKRAALRLAPLWRRAMRARPAARRRRRRPTSPSHALEAQVDVHAFVPARPLALRRAAPASRDVRVRGEELLANWFGWFNRTLEASADPSDIPWPLDPVRLPRLPRAAGGRPARCSSRGCRRGSSTT